MNTLSRLTLAAGAALFVGISTTGFNAQGHPHGDKLKKQAETKIAVPHTPAPKPMPIPAISSASPRAITARRKISILTTFSAITGGLM